MATYVGSQGIDQLRNKIRRQASSMVTGLVIDLGSFLIETSPVGLTEYPEDSPVPIYTNDAGTYKNSWFFSTMMEAGERVGSEGGSDSINDMYSSATGYELQDNFYIVNGAEHASNVEYGWKTSEFSERAIYRWANKDGHYVRNKAIGPAQQFSRDAVNEAKRIK